MDAKTKPFGGKAYRSIPHVPGSRVGPGDWSVDPGMAAIATRRARTDDRHLDRVVVTEKLDGSCCAVGKLEGRILPLVRAGYHARDSHYPLHHVFADWVDAHARRFDLALLEGERIAGEWMLLAHGTRYRIVDDKDLFVAFDLIAPGKDRGAVGRRPGSDETARRFDAGGLSRARVLSDGPAVAPDEALRFLGERGFLDALDPPEGVVYRVDTNGAYNFHCKFVRAGKVDGLYVPDFGLGATESYLNGPAAERWVARTGIDVDSGRARP